MTGSAAQVYGPSLLPAAYRWLADLGGTAPRTIQKALSWYGLLEGPAEANNPVILGWAAELGLGRSYRADSVPWCGLFAARVVVDAGHGPPSQTPLWALSWRGWGTHASQPMLGDLLVFVRPGGGHVGFCCGEDANCFHVLGGNEGDAVSIVRIMRGRLVAARRPAYHVQPATVRPWKLAPEGSPVSANEG